MRAFVPTPLPPVPALDLPGDRQQRLEQATLAVGRLDSVSALLPDPQLFLYAYVRREAVLSSQIEGTQSSLNDLLLFELDEAARIPFDDVQEVSNYVAALAHGMTRLREGFPLGNRLLRKMHVQLMAKGRGSDKLPGEFRRSQTWIGGTRPGNAHFVPPPLPTCRSQLHPRQYWHWPIWALCKNSPASDAIASSPTAPIWQFSTKAVRHCGSRINADKRRSNLLSAACRGAPISAPSHPPWATTGTGRPGHASLRLLRLAFLLPGQNRRGSFLELAP